MAARKSTTAVSEPTETEVVATEVPARLAGFTTEQIRMLSEMLDSSNVKKNPKGFDYIEGWHAMDVANRIFGFDGWDRETVTMTQVGEPYIVQDKYGKDQYRLAYLSKVRITVRAGDRVVVRDGTGYGSGIGKDLNDAHESAAKESETDSTKRALMTFGYQFGLALYDKEKEFVLTEAKKQAEAERIAYEKGVEDLKYRIKDRLAGVVDFDGLDAAYADFKALVKDVRDYDKPQGDALVALFSAKKHEIEVKQKESAAKEPVQESVQQTAEAAEPAAPVTETPPDAGFVLLWADGHTRSFPTVDEWLAGLERFLRPDGNYNQFHNFMPNVEMAKKLSSEALLSGNQDLVTRLSGAIDTARKIHAEKARAKAEA